MPVRSVFLIMLSVVALLGGIASPAQAHPVLPYIKLTANTPKQQGYSPNGNLIGIATTGTVGRLKGVQIHTMCVMQERLTSNHNGEIRTRWVNHAPGDTHKSTRRAQSKRCSWTEEITPGRFRLKAWYIVKHDGATTKSKPRYSPAMNTTGGSNEGFGGYGGGGAY